jgi:TorA maturation chaperone TorD
MRALLYLTAAGLFEQPGRESTDRLQALLAALLQHPSPDKRHWQPLLRQLADCLHPDEAQPAAEYNRLFVLAFPRVAAQPFGSYWLEPERQLMGRTTVAVRELMAAHGLGVEGSGLLPDHIVSELEFMAFLVAQESPHSGRDSQRRLLGEHLARWTPRFTEALRAARPSRRYLLAAELLDRLIAEDLAYLGEGRAPLPTVTENPCREATL